MESLLQDGNPDRPGLDQHTLVQGLGDAVILYIFVTWNIESLVFALEFLTVTNKWPTIYWVVIQAVC